MTFSDRNSDYADVSKKRLWTGRTRGGLIGNWIFAMLIRHLGSTSAYILLFPVSLYFIFFAPKAFRSSREYLAKVGYRDVSWLKSIWLSWMHFFSFGQTLIDRIAVLSGNGNNYKFIINGIDYILDALKDNKGVILLGSHCGNLEIAGQQLADIGVKVNIVAFEGEIARIRNFFDAVMSQRNFSMIAIDGSKDVAFEIIAALSRGEVVAMRGDRGLGNRTIVLPFLDENAKFPAGPFFFAGISGAPMIHTFAMRTGKFTYEFIAYPSQHFQFAKNESRESQVCTWALDFVKRLEEQVLKYPLQWYNFYPFWEDSRT